MEHFKTFESFINENKDFYTGVLNKITFDGDELYFVNITELGNIPVQNNVETDLGKDGLKNLIGKSSTWKVIEFNHLAKKPEARYRVAGLIKKII